MDINTFLTKEQQSDIENAIVEAEKCTSGEIRLHIDKKCDENVLDRAAKVFAQLKMHKTALRNGVLFYISVTDHKLAILGDAGINTKVPEGFWDQIKNHMVEKFSQNNYAEGLKEGIIMAGEKLRQHFPFECDDTNELSNEISFGN